MARVKKGMNAHKRHKKVLKQAKGFYGAKHSTFKAANPAVMRALRSAYIGRKLKKSGIDINRKMLAEIAIHNEADFAKLCETAKAAQAK